MPHWVPPSPESTSPWESLRADFPHYFTSCYSFHVSDSPNFRKSSFFQAKIRYHVPCR